MKLELKVTTKGGVSTTFSHSGPVVRIGRDPSCELALEGDAADTVSRQHTQIDLEDGEAKVSDSGSSNGTFLNGKQLKGPARLRAGDAIRLGYTGATITVTRLDLTEPAAAASALSGGHLQWLAIGGLALLLLVVTAVLLLRRSPSESLASNDPQVSQNPQTNTPPLSLPPAGAPPPSPPAGKPTPAPVNDAPKEPDHEEEELGSYQAPDTWGPSVLLQRRGLGYSWVRLGSGDKVFNDLTLLSLPGYQSIVALKSGVNLTLWGNLPEFSGWPPVAESVVVLLDPADTDADMELSRGRLLLFNNKPSGPAHVRVRLLKETWDITIAGKGDEVCIELWTLPWAGTSPDQPPRLTAEAHVMVRGKAQVKSGTDQVEIGDKQQAVWTNGAGAKLQAAPLPQVPAWWTSPPDRKNKQVETAMLSLLYWRDQFATGKQKNDGVLDVIRSKVQQTSAADPIGLLFLASLDAISPLVGFLNDPNRPNVRGAAAYALQGWLSRNPQHANILVGLLEQAGYARTKAELLVRLMYLIPREAIKPATVTELVTLLDHDELTIRERALWHLAELTRAGIIPEKEARAIDYDPQAEPEKRQAAVEQWKRLVAANKNLGR
jgi:hypothetical protein